MTKTKNFRNFRKNGNFSKILTIIKMFWKIWQKSKIFENFRKFWLNSKFIEKLTKIEIFRKFYPNGIFSKFDQNQNFFQKCYLNGIFSKFSKFWPKSKFYENFDQNRNSLKIFRFWWNFPKISIFSKIF